MKKILSFILPIIVGYSSCMLPDENKEIASDQKLRQTAFTDTLDGKVVNYYTLENKQGMKVEFSNFGATIIGIHVPGKSGLSENVVLGYDSIGGYYSGTSYFGCVVGRFANRIAKGKFSIEGKEYNAPINNGQNTLHGGVKSIDKQVWDAREINDGIVFSIKVEDGENGYPGELRLKVTYSLREDNSLVIDYQATSDKTTVINVTNHAYFNLTSKTNQSILSHNLMLNASKFTPVDSTLIPIGVHMDVANTPFDFTASKQIGKDIGVAHEQLLFGKGYDHNFVLTEAATPLKLAAVVSEETSGRKMEVFTTQPGIQFYSGNFLDGTEKANGTAYQFRTGFCLETQHFPDSPNQPTFPTTLLKPGEKFESQTIYKFSTLK
jgi:aldose 1-epimerase